MLQAKAALWAVYLGGEMVATIGARFGLTPTKVKSDLVESGEFPPEITVKEIACFGTLPTTTQ